MCACIESDKDNLMMDRFWDINDAVYICQLFVGTDILEKR